MCPFFSAIHSLLLLLCVRQSNLAAVNKKFAADYTLRRKMLLKRLDVTTQSFLWSPRGKVGPPFAVAVCCMHAAAIVHACGRFCGCVTTEQWPSCCA